MTATTSPVERCFDLTWPSWQPPHRAGLVALLASGANATWAQRLLGRNRDGWIVWAPAAENPARQAMTTATLPHVHAVVLTERRGDARRTALALEFARHLATIRDLPGPRSCATSPTRPTHGAEAIRIPHLVAVRRGGVVRDTAVWELMTPNLVPEWLEASLPDQEFFDRHLPDLLRLRAAARTGRLPPTAAGLELTQLLHGRYLSIRLVYQHPQLFHALLDHDGGGRP